MRKAASCPDGLPRPSASTNVQAAAAVEAVMATMKEALQQGEPVILRRFGTWQVHAKRARVVAIPRPGPRPPFQPDGSSALWSARC